jgi:hypothetical protein
VNGLLFTLAGMLAAQRRRAANDLERDVNPCLGAVRGAAA